MLAATAAPPVMTASRCPYVSPFTCLGASQGGIAATPTTSSDSRSAQASPIRSAFADELACPTVAATGVAASDAAAGASGPRGVQVELVVTTLARFCVCVAARCRLTCAGLCVCTGAGGGVYAGGGGGGGVYAGGGGGGCGAGGGGGGGGGSGFGPPVAPASAAGGATA